MGKHKKMRPEFEEFFGKDFIPEDTQFLDTNIKELSKDELLAVCDWFMNNLRAEHQTYKLSICYMWFPNKHDNAMKVIWGP